MCSSDLTGDQQLVDGPHKDLRRARGAAINIVPTSTGAARATSLVLESMKGKLDGTSIRVPTPNVSVVDLKCVLAKAATEAEINQAMQDAAAGKTFKGLMTADGLVRKGEGEKAKESKVSDFRAAMSFLMTQAENSVGRQRYKGLGEMKIGRAHV